MRRFELVEGTSSKFWEVAIKDGDVTVRFGRIGTNGQTKTKNFGSEAAARKEYDALVKEKTGKGYGEVAVADGAVLTAVPAATPTPAPAKVKPADPQPEPEPPPAQAAPARDEPVPQEPAAAAACAPQPEAAAIDWPEGGFDWDNEWRALVPVVRGIRAAQLKSADELIAETPEFDDKDTYGWRSNNFSQLVAGLQRNWTMWDARTVQDMAGADRLRQADPQFWLQLCTQCTHIQTKGDSSLHGWYFAHTLMWATQVGIALHGIPFMLGVAFELVRGVRAAGMNSLERIIHSVFGPLLQSITACSDEEHAQVTAWLERLAGDTPFDRLLRAAVCPHRGDWALQSMAEDNPEDAQYLDNSVVPPEDMRRYMKKCGHYFRGQQEATALQIHLHGAAATALLGDLLDRAPDRRAAEESAKLLLRMRAPEAVRQLAERIENKEARAALETVARSHPAAALRCAIEQALSSRSRMAEGWAVRLALREPAALVQALASLDEGQRSRFQATLQTLQTAEAAPGQLPPLLREPPWLGKARASELPTLDITPAATPERLEWTPEQIARHADYEISPYRFHGVTDHVAAVVENLWITPSGRTRLLAGQPLQDGDVGEPSRHHYGHSLDHVLIVPDDAFSLALWNSYPAKYWSTGYADHLGPLLAILARHGIAALPGLLGYIQSSAEDGLLAAQEIDSPRIAPAALHALRNLKKAKAPAMAWLRAHAATALAAALPLAFGRDRTQRDNAQFGLRWLVAQGLEAQAHAAAEACGPPVAQALQALLHADPLLVLPSRMPKLPGFFVAPSFRRPELRDGGGALPASALEHIGSMLAISKLEAPYPGVAIVKETCEAGSLAEFAWDLFEAWLAAGAPSKEGWAFTALGLLGNDETARRLAPRIREWPGEAAHARAVAGLDLLAAIGTDTALMHLNGIAGKVKFKALQDRAKEKIAAVAEARGLSATELADRLVPDLGLDETGTLLLDFGARRFSVSFDEALKPYVKDAQGARLKDLPKPLKSDDPALSEAAVERWKQLKKDAKAIATLQVTRMELSMVARRRWSGADFRLFFLEHPLMRHLAARVVWGIYDEQGQVSGGLRIAEDWSLADAQDEETTLPDDATVGIAHVLEMPQAMQAAFGQVFADYEILQPFRQLGREVYRLTPEEAAGIEIKRFADKAVSTGSVLGLVNRGWERGAAQDAGWVNWFSKEVGGGLEVELEIDPGTVVGDLGFEPKQRIPRLVLRKIGSWGDKDLQRFAQLDPVLASEILRDVDLLAPFKEPQ